MEYNTHHLQTCRSMRSWSRQPMSTCVYNLPYSTTTRAYNTVSRLFVYTEDPLHYRIPRKVISLSERPAISDCVNKTNTLSISMHSSYCPWLDKSMLYLIRQKIDFWHGFMSFFVSFLVLGRGKPGEGRGEGLSQILYVDVPAGLRKFTIRYT